ncbi:MAG TPA: iron dependent repressor, metal binding and dimerization domain protein, partial [Acidimicrobiales bacterium]|nr:iron dependent repressor, metal binding and dimerization domain protein [Acidimicrobiales bacterium]
GRGVKLSDEGTRRAESVVRKHRLAERFLVDIVGLPWHKAHLEAGRWEHVISDEVEERLVLLLGNPATCPHGNPIPGGPETDPSNEQFRLADADEGMAVRLERVTEEVEIDTEALSYLGVKGFVTGSVAQVVSKRSGVLELAMGSETFELPSRICTHLFVTIVDSDASTSSAA